MHSKEDSLRCQGVFKLRLLLRGMPGVPERCLPCVPAMPMHWLEAAHGKCGLNANVGIGFRAHCRAPSAGTLSAMEDSKHILRLASNNVTQSNFLST